LGVILAISDKTNNFLEQNVDDILLKESDLIAALGLLFSPDGRNLKQMLDSIGESDIKKAYRKKALQTHPDRFVSFDEDYRRQCSERFIEVNNAYEMLNTYLKMPRDKGLNGRSVHTSKNSRPTAQYEWRPPRSRADSGNRSGDFYTHSFWQKDVPGRRLRFAEFLYYSGVIPWKPFIRALVWQGKQRPRVGEIAQRWRWLSEQQIIGLLRGRRPGELIGQVLLQNEIISPFQLNVLLCQQRKWQKPIGEYFVEEGLLRESQIRDILLRQQRHNRIYHADRPFHSNSNF
jgi:hypothetical protein